MRRLRFALAVSLLLLPAAAAAQVFDSDNVVLLANEEQFLGYSDVWGYVGNDGREYVIQGLTTGTAWWDIADPVSPVLVKVIGGPASGWRDMFVIGDYCYVGTEGGGGIQIIDLSDPTDPTLVNVYDATVGRTHNIFGDASRNLLFTAGGYTSGANGGIQILDTTDPVNLVEIGRWTNTYVHDLSVEGDYIFACLISDGKLRRIDITDPTNPVNAGNFTDPNGSVHACWPVGNGTHVMIAEETGGGHVKSIDVSVPTAMFIADANNPQPAASAHNVHVEGDKCWVSWYARGTRILDVTDPENLNEIGYLDTYPDHDAGGVGPGQWGVYPHLPSGVIAANDRPYGLFLFRYEPDAATLEGTVSSSAGGFIEGASVEYVDLDNGLLTDETGAYRFSAFPGPTNELRFSAYGFQADTISVATVADMSTTTNVTLTKLPSGGVSGVIEDASSGQPIEAADVHLVGSPFVHTTDATGSYSFPDVPSASYQIRVLRYGYQVPPDVPVVIETGEVTTRDIAITAAGIYEDFATPAGWSVSDQVHANDPANASGTWVFAEPFGTFSNGSSVNPQDDHTLDPEDQCAVTGNAAAGQPSADDVDSLTTQLLSPVYDLSGMAEPHVFYYRWWFVDTEGEPFVAEATGDGGSNWALLESQVTREGTWIGVDVNLTGLLASYDAVQFRFTAQDPDDSQLMEAGLDDFSIYDRQGGAVGAPFPGSPSFGLELAQNFPNPFPSGTRIRFTMPAEAWVELSVFDVRGSRVATLVDGVRPAGPQEVGWDGRTYAGGEAANGVYFYKLSTERQVRTRRMIRLN